MSLMSDKSFKMKMRDVETAFKYRRFPYPKRSVELIALLAISCTFFLFMHTNKLNSRLKEMEMKLQPSEFSALGLTGSNHLDGPKPEDINTLHGTYQYLKSTGQYEQLKSSDLNNTHKAERDVVLFTQIPRTGSTTLVKMLADLAQRNDFVAHTDDHSPEEDFSFDRIEREEFLEEFFDLEGYFSYSEHRNWINMTEYDLPTPIYVSLVRHPIQKVMSAYYEERNPFVFINRIKDEPDEAVPQKPFFDTTFNDCVAKGKRPACTFDSKMAFNKDWRRMAMHFCGNKPVCRNFNSPVATQIAKQNIEREYAVVGSWEDTNITLTVLEHYIPRFFRGATEMYYSDKSGKFKKNATPHNTNLEPEVEAKLKIQFSYEIELYNFCKQRLYKQYIAIKKEELMAKFN